jgi:[ribosomal protein S18]-alanine N-acetyltransferase
MGEQETAAPKIRRLLDIHEAETCARIMSTSEPWTTLGSDYESSLGNLTDPLKESYIATSNGEILGFIILNMRGAFVGYIHAVCVGPGWRDQGLGSVLVEFAEKRIFTEAPNVFLCVSSFNQEALRLFRRLGYEVIGEMKDLFVRGQPETFLRKTIAPLAEFRKKET